MKIFHRAFVVFVLIFLFAYIGVFFLSNRSWERMLLNIQSAEKATRHEWSRDNAPVASMSDRERLDILAKCLRNNGFRHASICCAKRPVNVTFKFCSNKGKTMVLSLCDGGYLLYGGWEFRLPSSSVDELGVFAQ